MTRRTALLGALLLCAPLALCQSSPQSSPEQPDTRPAAALAGTHWTLTRLNGEAVTADPEKKAPYIELDDASKRLSGSGGCNRLLGSYEVDGSTLHFKQVASTMMACPGDAMTHEQAFIRALESVTSYRIRGSTLLLRDKDKTEVARFEAQPNSGSDTQ
ncbi:MAG: META domain-containing protein [Candidatus Eremiobacteraeota bacterium]|nr:META domain-containing protein [Candidatus Eremiobacteraeota bacterium]